LALPHYIPLLTTQSYPTRRSVATEVIRTILQNKTKITTAENLERILSVLKVLIKEGAQNPALHQQRRGETDETIDEQGWLARLVHLIRGPDNDTQLKASLFKKACGVVAANVLFSCFKQLVLPMRMATSA
jgi:vacuolar protein sorting-associated protein 35